MAHITRFPLVRRLRADMASHIQLYRDGKLIKQGRGLDAWLLLDRTGVVEVPMDDRPLPVFFNAITADYQDVAVQGTLVWRVADPVRLAERIDLTLNLDTGRWDAEPIEQIRNTIAAQAQQYANAYLKTLDVRAALEAGPAPLQAEIEARFAADTALDGLGLTVVGAVIATLTPTKELARALQTPTFEALQQQADEATFARRALAVEKEQAIAENELATQIELATRREALIDREQANARMEAEAEAEVERLQAQTHAERIRVVAEAETKAEAARLKLLDARPPAMILALAARDFAAKLDHIDQLTLTPDMLEQLARAVGTVRAA